MFATHREENRHNQILDLLESERDGIRILIARKGAELVGLERQRLDGTWAPFLWRDSDVSGEGPGWKNHSTVMGHYVHRLLEGRTTYAGEEMSGGTHSFLRQVEFSSPAFGSDHGSHLTYKLPHQEIPEGAYPRKVDFSITYRLAGPCLEVEFHYRNREKDRPAHVSFGLHPGFAVSSISSFVLLAPPGLYVRHLAPENFLSGEVELHRHEGGPFQMDRSVLVDSYLYNLENVANRVFTLADPAAGRQVELDYTEAPYLTIWSDGVGNFLCVEPCWGLPDHHEQRPFEQKQGIQLIAPGESLTRKIRIHPSLIPDD